MDLMDDPQQAKTTGNKKTHNPEWLKDLEIQSWQAELVISGLLITGLFQLPDVFLNWVEPKIIQSGELEFIFLKFASLYFMAGIDCVVIFFGLHLLFRGIWVALLGLNSVYPNGIDAQSKNGLGEKYWKKLKEKYPSLTQYNLYLDANCSLLFSLATSVIIMITSLSVFILLFYQCVRLLTTVFPAITDHAVPIGIVLYLIFVLTSLAIQYLGKRYPDSKAVEKTVTGFSTAIGSLFSLYVFQKPIGYINSIYFSNTKSKYFKIVLVAVSAVMGLMSGIQLNQRDVFNDLDAEKYFTFNNKPYQILPYNYENLLEKEAQVYTPIIQSDVVADDFLKVFIPTIEREKEHMGVKEYTLVARFKMNTAQREAAKNERLESYKRFNRIYVNGIEYPNLDFHFYQHPQAAENGLLVYVPSQQFTKGRNILEIRKNYFSKDSVQKIVKIPFFFNK